MCVQLRKNFYRSTEQHNSSPYTRNRGIDSCVLCCNVWTAAGGRNTGKRDYSRIIILNLKINILCEKYISSEINITSRNDFIMNNNISSALAVFSVQIYHYCIYTLFLEAFPPTHSIVFRRIFLYFCSFRKLTQNENRQSKRILNWNCYFYYYTLF